MLERHLVHSAFCRVGLCCMAQHNGGRGWREGLGDDDQKLCVARVWCIAPGCKGMLMLGSPSDCGSTSLTQPHLDLVIHSWGLGNCKWKVLQTLTSQEGWPQPTVSTFFSLKNKTCYYLWLPLQGPWACQPLNSPSCCQHRCTAGHTPLLLSCLPSSRHFSHSDLAVLVLPGKWQECPELCWSPADVRMESWAIWSPSRDVS